VLGSRLTGSLPVAVLLTLAAVALTLYRLEYGLLLLPVIAAVVPLSIGTGTGSLVVASLLFSGFLLLLWPARMLLRGDLRLANSSITLPLVGFVIAVAVSTVYSEVERPPLVTVWPTFRQAQLGGLSMFVISAAVLLLVMNTLRELHWIERLTFVFLALGAVDIVGYAFLQRDLPGFQAGGLFSLWIVTLALGQALFNRDVPGWARVGLVALATAWLVRRFMFENDWLSGWVPTFVAVLGLFFLRSRKHGLFALAVAAIIGLLSFQDIYARATGDSGSLLRLPIWLQSLELTRDHLLLGTGPAGYAPYYVTYFQGFAFSTHSNYLDILAQTGLVGTLFFAWFLFAVFRLALRARSQSPNGFAAGFANGALAGFVGLGIAMALGDWFIPFVYNAGIAGFRHTIHSWIFLGALAAMERMNTIGPGAKA